MLLIYFQILQVLLYLFWQSGLQVGKLPQTRALVSVGLRFSAHLSPFNLFGCLQVSSSTKQSIGTEVLFEAEKACMLSHGNILMIAIAMKVKDRVVEVTLALD